MGQRSPTPLGSPRRDVLARLALSLFFIVAASTIAWALAYGLGVQRVSMIYLVAVLLCAAWLGTTYGILSAVAATVAFNLLFGPPPLFELALGTRQDIVNLVVFVGSAWVVGLYADELRRSYEALARLSRFDDGAHALGPYGAPDERRGAWLRELLRLAGAFGFTAMAAAVATLAFDVLDIPRVSMVFLAFVVIAAMALGTRFALIASVLSVLVFDFLFVEPRFTLQLETLQAGANLVVFAGTAWLVGTFAEQVRYERRAVRSLFLAGRGLSATADEATLRAIICDAVCAATGGRAAVLRDENGAVCCERGDLPEGDPPPGVEGEGFATVGGWRIRPLAVEGRAFGSVAWYAPRSWTQPDLPVDRTVNVLVDIGAAAIARARLSAENARMEVIARTEELRRALLASVSHDVRTPLAGILGSATSLLEYGERYDAAVRQDLLSNIREQAHRLNRYVENLLGMTRLEAGALEARPQRVALEPLALETWETIAGLVGERAPPRFEIDAGLYASADPTLLRQALGNVLENAVKYSGKGDIEILGDVTDDEAVLIVVDRGPGVRGEDLHRLFEPFERGKTAQAGGFGLGLFIARSFMEAMGGSIIVGNRDDGASGLAVRLIMPKAAEGKRGG
ncbi:MAG TPA: DUF4118 domain-containing protein [Caulobacteraceae bacterium]